MSPNRQPLRDLPLGLVLDEVPQRGFTIHTHNRHQLSLASRGVLLISTTGHTWVLPGQRALWVPAGVAHSVKVSGPTTMVSIYLDQSRCPLDWKEPTVVDATGLVGPLVAYLARGQQNPSQKQRAESVLWDVIAPLSVASLQRTLPVDGRARDVAEGLIADPADSRSLEQWGRTVGASGRTLARLFRSETGIGFEQWRRTTRIAAALPMLADGIPVATAARRVGYATQSAFVAAFRREVGTTPAQYFTGGT
jgi:AraC-like DNA-binding protein